MELTPRFRITSQDRVDRPPTAVRWGEQLQVMDVPEDILPSGVKRCERILGAESRPGARWWPLTVPRPIPSGRCISGSGSLVASRPSVFRIPSSFLHVTFLSLYVAFGPSNDLVHALGGLLGQRLIELSGFQAVLERGYKYLLIRV